MSDHPTSLQPLIHRGRIVFGCGKLHHIHRARTRERLLLAALDGGILRFDVAPAYGNGLAERCLGAAIGKWRHDVKVITKVGIPAHIYPAVADHAFPAFRAIDILMGSHRRAYDRRRFDAAILRESLDGSLRRLRVGVIDTYLLHEPIAPFTRGDWDHLRAAMDEFVRLGKIRAWGIAGPADRYGLARMPEPPALIQQPLAELSGGAPTSVIERIAYHVFAEFSRAGTGMTFAQYLMSQAEKYTDVSFIITTVDIARLRSWTAQVPE